MATDPPSASPRPPPVSRHADRRLPAGWVRYSYGTLSIGAPAGWQVVADTPSACDGSPQPDTVSAGIQPPLPAGPINCPLERAGPPMDGVWLFCRAVDSGSRVSRTAATVTLGRGEVAISELTGSSLDRQILTTAAPSGRSC